MPTSCFTLITRIVAAVVRYKCQFSSSCHSIVDVRFALATSAHVILALCRTCCRCLCRTCCRYLSCLVLAAGVCVILAAGAWVVLAAGACVVLATGACVVLAAGAALHGCRCERRVAACRLFATSSSSSAWSAQLHPANSAATQQFKRQVSYLYRVNSRSKGVMYIY